MPAVEICRAVFRSEIKRVLRKAGIPVERLIVQRF